MTIVDHLMMFVLAIGLPVVGGWSYRRFVRRVEAGVRPDRVALCCETMLVQWSALAVLVAAWLWFRRPFADLGLTVPGGTGFVIGLLLLAPLLAWLIHARRRARVADAAQREKFVAELGSLRHFLPDTRVAYRSFVGLSITAGIVEEIAFRGFAFWYFGHYLPVWAVILAAAVAFGFGHLYQGTANALRVTLGGIAFGAYYLLTGSIWLPIIAHALVDILQGAMVYEYLRVRPEPAGAEAAPLPSTRD